MYSIDEKDALDARSLDGVLAGRPKQARYDLLKAFELILRAGESK